MAQALEQRPFGRTAQHVTSIGLGGGSLGKHSLDTGVATVHRALDLGVNYFDTAPFYDQRASQVIMGYALQGRTEPHMLATKLGFLHTIEQHRCTESLWAQLGENLVALRRGQVDVLQIHQASMDCWWQDGARENDLIRIDQDYDFSNAPVLHVLRRAKAEGLCRFIGLTADHPDELAHILQHIDLDLDSCLVAHTYNILNRRARRLALPAVRERGLSYIVGGVLSGVGVGKDNCDERLRDLQQTSSLSLVDLAVRYAIGDSDITNTLIGAANPTEIEQSVAAAQQGPLAPDVQQAVDALVKD